MTLWTVVRLLVYALLLVLVLRGLRLAVTLAPTSAARRRSLLQAFPVVELLLAVIYVFAAIRELFDDWPEAVAGLGVVFGGLWLARFALMDLVTGVVLRAGGSLGRGDRVRVGDLEGRVTQLGPRAVAIETRGGDEALIPYSVLGRSSVIRTPVDEGAHRHTFRLGPERASQPERLRRLALLCHWSAVARPPAIERRPDGGCEVTVFAVAADRGPAIEAFVRGGLEAADVLVDVRPPATVAPSSPSERTGAG